MAEQVICVDDSVNPAFIPNKQSTHPIKGNTYTVRANLMGTLAGDGALVPIILLEEISTHKKHSITGVEIGYNAARFAPIRDDSLDIFRDTTRKIEDDQFDNKRVDA